MDIKTNQDKLLSELIRPMKLDGETTRGQLIGVQQENELIRHDIKSLQMQVDRLGEQGQKVDPGFMSELKAVGDTIEGLKNSIFMINKKIDMIDPDVRIGKIETKIKELILYLQQLTQTINARSTQQR
ncbi:hypothetical protein COT47_06165 [Candidatus Woesearchaeota archaeon CG08_land_8_20_14_0_20_43_7]|nr:MAG: hypothetical protein COT47_06165 [Candidatus Woesearchaeota archaeon CG08_land_8_20_14_0_20_43_7]